MGKESRSDALSAERQVVERSILNKKDLAPEVQAQRRRLPPNPGRRGAAA